MTKMRSLPWKSLQPGRLNINCAYLESRQRLSMIDMSTEKGSSVLKKFWQGYREWQSAQKNQVCQDKVTGERAMDTWAQMG
jgi:hypothetical protein